MTAFDTSPGQDSTYDYANIIAYRHGRAEIIYYIPIIANMDLRGMKEGGQRGGQGITCVDSVVSVRSHMPTNREHALTNAWPMSSAISNGSS